MDIDSIIIYSLTFFVSSISVYIYEYAKLNKFIRIIIMVLGVSTICLLAALRDYSVGRDINVYLLPNYEYALKSNYSFWDYYLNLPVDNEILFALIVYFCAQLGSFGLLCFVLEALTITPMMYVFCKNRKNISITLGYMLYLFLFYNFTLSGMRASISMSFFFLSCYFLFQKRRKIFGVSLLVAFFFHKAVLIPALITLYIYFALRSNHTKKTVLLLVLFISCITLMIAYSSIAQILEYFVAYINPRYAYYIEHYLIMMPGFNPQNIYVSDMLFKSLIFIGSACLVSRINGMDLQKNTYLLLCTMGRYFVFFNSFFYESMRIAYYFDFFLLLFAPLCTQSLKRKPMIIVSLSMILVSFLYWTYFIMYIGGYSTNLYIFR